MPAVVGRQMIAVMNERIDHTFLATIVTYDLMVTTAKVETKHLRRIAMCSGLHPTLETTFNRNSRLV